MKRYAYLLAPLLAAAATPALAAEPAPRASAASTLIQRQLESRASSEQTRATLARLREALEVRKQELKDAATRAQQDANGLCSDCPEKAAPTHHHSVSAEHKVDCIHCIEQAIYA